MSDDPGRDGPDEPARSIRRRLLPLLVVLFVAAALRGPALASTGPIEDEDYYLRGAATMLERGSPTIAFPNLYPYQNPSGYHFLAAAAMVAQETISTGRLGGGPGMVARYRARPDPFRRAARLATLLVSLFAIAAVWFAALRLTGPAGALVAAALLTLSPLHLRYSIGATNDGLLCAWTALFVWLLLRYQDRPSVRRALAVGAALGAAGATKYRAILLLPLAIVAPLRGHARDRTQLVWVGVGALLALILIFPGLILEPAVVLRSLRRQGRLPGGVWPGGSTDPAVWQHAAILLRALGPLGLALALAGLATSARRKPELALYVVVHLAFFLPMTMVFIRFDLPLVVFLCLLAAAPANALLVRVRRSRGRPAAALLLALILLPPAACSTRITRLLSVPDTRADLRAWLLARLEAGERPAVAFSFAAVDGIPRVAEDDRKFDPRLASGSLLFGLSDPPAPDLLERVRRRPGALVILTSSDVDWSPARRRFEAQLAGIAPRVFTIEPGPDVPHALAESSVPWSNLRQRRRPGPSIRVYAIGP